MNTEKKETLLGTNKLLSASPKLEMYATSWTIQLETAAKIIGERAQGFKIMHIQASKRHRSTYNRLMYLSIVFGPLAAIISGIGVTLYPDDPSLFPVISSIIAFLAGIFVSVVKFSKFEQSASAHKLAAAKYTSLENNVRRQLTLPRNVRTNAARYTHWLSTSYDDLFLASPLIDTHIVRRYNAGAKASGLSVPLEQEIVISINTDYDHGSINTQLSTNPSPDVPSLNKVPRSPSKTVTRKKHEIIPLPELKQFGDGMMKYEVDRMMAL